MMLMTWAAHAQTPVLVELFTSEGCSSCPPADALLEQLDRDQPVPGATIIVLSEHVDYWNHLGWSDPYSAATFSRRQETYGLRFSLPSVYTPQMVVDGRYEFTGGDAGLARISIRNATKDAKIPITLTASGGVIRAVIAAARKQSAELWIALADESDASQVTRGENSGRRLHHVAVVRSLTPLGAVDLSRDVVKEFKPGAPGQRVVAFIQAKNQGPVLGAALLR